MLWVVKKTKQKWLFSLKNTCSQSQFRKTQNKSGVVSSLGVFSRTFLIILIYIITSSTIKHGFVVSTFCWHIRPNVKCSLICESLWIKASAKWINTHVKNIPIWIFIELLSYAPGSCMTPEVKSSCLTCVMREDTDTLLTAGGAVEETGDTHDLLDTWHSSEVFLLRLDRSPSSDRPKTHHILTLEMSEVYNKKKKLETIFTF